MRKKREQFETANLYSLKMNEVTALFKKKIFFRAFSSITQDPLGETVPQTLTSVLLVSSTVLTNETRNLERVNSPLQTCLCHLGKTIFLNAILYRKLGPLKLGPRNQIKTFKHVVYVYIYICIYIKIPPLQ